MAKVREVGRGAPTQAVACEWRTLEASPLNEVIRWQDIDAETEFLPGTILKNGGSSIPSIYAIVLGNWNGILDCYVANSDQRSALFAEDILKGGKDWQSFQGDREPNLSDKSHVDLMENAIVVLLLGRAGLLTEEQCVLLDYQLGDPGLDDGPLEPAWRKIARSVWLPEGESKAVEILGRNGLA